ncbi:MAG: 6,7-dimethyl-8-ribityllumazine synthase [Oceanicoccus sp.]|uniref:6,7-dimethyl-8-ribityllumazine synthase n=1 Tax=Oceanicoccus sp. TaxID=2691044 RepID=UPI0026149FD3|nr:6,7-dimethyl-8-ribityllumazine synthase [Oceanicoccus sp.]MCP3907836.1 6,7-dimethyl-8-ribityllumazine synthase [Oceanicoccus sp.]MDG1772325.1 6,7-dimethyl-8-ribityllumazine synthase [Oceanicoccus sp.]
MKGIETPEYDAAIIAGKKIAIVVTRWNTFIVDNLLAGAKKHLTENGIEEANIELIMCPGAYEIPLACQHVAASKKYDAIITLGAVIRGGTPHFEYVAGECSSGVMRVSLDTGMPIAFGVLTVDNEQQALERCGVGENSENKGEESAACVLEMLCVIGSLNLDK